MRYLVHSEAPPNHPNEDAVGVRPHPASPDMLLCALADGQGGQRGGAAAARLAVEAALAAAAALPVKQMSGRTTWPDVIREADTAVATEGAAGFTTLIALSVADDRVYGAATGDSAALLVTPRSQIILTEGQHKNPPVGSGAARPVGFSGRIEPGTTLLVMSDGVWKYVGFETVVALTRSSHGPELIPALRAAHVQERRGFLADDFSIVVVWQEGGA